MKNLLQPSKCIVYLFKKQNIYYLHNMVIELYVHAFYFRNTSASTCGHFLSAGVIKSVEIEFESIRVFFYVFVF